MFKIHTRSLQAKTGRKSSHRASTKKNKIIQLILK